MIERYATVTAWAEWFRRNEGVKIDDLTIQRRLARLKKMAVAARAQIGRIMYGSFYLEKDVREACADLLAPLPIANRSGFVQINGVCHGTANSLARLLGVGESTIPRRLQGSKVIPVSGRAADGNVRDFYPEPQIRELCADLLGQLQVADKVGFIEVAGVRYGTARALARSLGVGGPTVEARILKGGIGSVQGKDSLSRIQNFYSEPQIRELCADLLAPLPLVDENNCIHVNGVRHGAIYTLERLLGIGNKIIRSRIRKSGILPVRGKDGQGRIQNFYPEPAVRELCADRFAPLPSTDENNFIEVGGVRHGTVRGIARLLGMDRITISYRIRDFGIVSVRGKDKKGRIADFYPEPRIRALCEDLLEPLPQADPDGFAVVNGVRHGSVLALSHLLGVSQCTILNRIRDASPVAIHCFDRGGRVQDFYPESEIQKLCADLLGPKIQADADGFALVNGVRCGTVVSLARQFNISPSAILARLESSGVAPVPGMAIGGQIRKLYPESQVRDLCADLLDPNIPVCATDGFVDIGGVRHGAITVLGRLLRISPTTVLSRVSSSGVLSVRGKGKSGQLVDLFPESIIRELCKDLLEKKSKKSNPKPR
jgi:hypothetical protein